MTLTVRPLTFRTPTLRKTLKACAPVMLAAIASSALPASAQSPLIGNYQGSPYATWQGLYQQGVQVRTFYQPLEDRQILRRYLMYIPQKIYQREKDYPLVIVLPGANTSAEQLRHYDLDDRVERLADEQEFILVYGNGYSVDSQPAPHYTDDPFNANKGYWRGCSGPPGQFAGFYDIDDSDYIQRVVAQMQNEALPIDTDRIYVWGLSNGGEMAMQVARDIPETIAAAGAVMPVPNMPGTEPWGFCDTQPQGPTSMMVIYSPNDTVISPLLAQFGFDYEETFERSMLAWASAFGIDTSTAVEYELPDLNNEGEGYNGSNPAALATMNSSLTRTDYTPAANGAAFSVIRTLPNAGHQWPNFNKTPLNEADHGNFGFKNNDIEAEQVLWDFVKDKTRIPQD